MITGGGGCRVPITSITLLIFNFYMLPKRGTTPCKFKIRVCCEKKWGRGSPPPPPADATCLKVKKHLLQEIQLALVELAG